MAKKAAPKAAAAAPAEKPARAKPKTKAEVYTALAEKTGVPKKDIDAVFKGLHEIIVKELGKKGPGVFQIPGLLKLNVQRKPAVKEHKGIDPFTKQERVFKAKPARNVVKAKPLKALKDQV